MKKLNFIILLFITNVAVFAQTLNTIKKTTNQTIQHADIETSKTIQADVVFYNLLGLHTDNKFVLQHTNIDKSGIKHDRYQQYYRGIRVEGGTYTLHGQNGKYKHISGNFENITNIATQATFTEDIALQKVMSAVGATEYAWQNIEAEKFIKQLREDDKASYAPKAELVLTRNWDLFAKTGEIKHHLCYAFYIRATQPLKLAVQKGNVAN